MNFYGFCKIAAQINLKKTLAKTLGAPTASQPEADRQGPRASDPPAGSRQGTRLDLRVGAATASRGARAHARAR